MPELLAVVWGETAETQALVVGGLEVAGDGLVGGKEVDVIRGIGSLSTRGSIRE
jgi:putative sterol carrier protein